jgi:small subunit ribosomal protein S16
MLKIRLRRMGSRHRPFYRLVVSDRRQVPTATSLEELGTYDPRQAAGLRLDLERIDAWIKKGALPSETVSRLIAKARAGAKAAAAVDAPAEPVKARRGKKTEAAEVAA